MFYDIEPPGSSVLLPLPAAGCSFEQEGSSNEDLKLFLSISSFGEKQWTLFFSFSSGYL